MPPALSASGLARFIRKRAFDESDENGFATVQRGSGRTLYRAKGSYVTFEPGARTNWHTHPFGQTLTITAGYGRVQSSNGAVEIVRPGDRAWFKLGEKHWH